MPAIDGSGVQAYLLRVVAEREPHHRGGLDPLVYACNQREIYQAPACIYNIGMKNLTGACPAGRLHAREACEGAVLDGHLQNSSF